MVCGLDGALLHGGRVFKLSLAFFVPSSHRFFGDFFGDSDTFFAGELPRVTGLEVSVLRVSGREVSETSAELIFPPLFTHCYDMPCCNTTAKSSKIAELHAIFQPETLEFSTKIEELVKGLMKAKLLDVVYNWWHRSCDPALVP